jgi:hypothetical protein
MSQQLWMRCQWVNKSFCFSDVCCIPITTFYVCADGTTHGPSEADLLHELDGLVASQEGIKVPPSLPSLVPLPSTPGKAVISPAGTVPRGVATPIRQPVSG